MELLIHVVIAFSSLLWTAFLLFGPTYRKLAISKVLIGLTFASGTYLVATTPAYMVHACIAGLAYTAMVMIATAMASQRLAAKNSL